MDIEHEALSAIHEASSQSHFVHRKHGLNESKKTKKEKIIWLI